MAYWSRYPRFAPSRPREARGGIKARSQRGTFGGSWWAGRWNAVLEGFQLGGRLARGRSYARRGQVLDVAVEAGRVRARVQGSRPRPYEVDISVKTLSRAEWERVGRALAREARFAAKLLASEMPEDVESAFRAAKVSLFPERSRDLRTECSCPDWSNPCKHIAAVYYLLGEEFDRDPFLIFKLRGASREDLVRSLGQPVPAGRRGPLPGERVPADVTTASQPLRPDPAAFWTGGLPPEGPLAEAPAAGAPAALLRRLGDLPFWRGAAPLLECLEPAYARAAARGLAVSAGMRDDDA